MFLDHFGGLSNPSAVHGLHRLLKWTRQRISLSPSSLPSLTKDLENGGLNPCEAVGRPPETSDPSKQHSVAVLGLPHSCRVLPGASPGVLALTATNALRTPAAC